MNKDAQDTLQVAGVDAPRHQQLARAADRAAKRRKKQLAAMLPEPSSMIASPYHTFHFSISRQDAVDLRASLVEVLNAFRVTLREHNIEVLYAELPEVPAQPERVDRFYRTALGRIVQFGRETPPVVTIETQARDFGFDLVISAQRLTGEGKPDRMHVVARFQEEEA
jgi:hypothetical protein